MSSSVSSFVLDCALGLYASASPVPPSEWRSWCAGRSAGRYVRACRAHSAGVDDGVVRALIVEMVLFDGLADALPADEVLARAGSLLDCYDSDGVIVPVPSAVSDGLLAWLWCCPDCVDDDGDPVPLVYDGHGGWSCPSCGCSTSSPVDDACVVRGVDGAGACGEVLRESAGVDSGECVRRSAACWDAVRACEKAGMWSDVLRYVVRANLWEYASFDWSDDDRPLAEWVADVIDDVVASYGRPLSCPVCPDGCVACLLGGCAR